MSGLTGKQWYEWARDFYPKSLGSLHIEYVEGLREENKRLKKALTKK